MKPNEPAEGLLGRRDFFSRLGKGLKRKAAAAAALPRQEEIHVSASELTVHSKADLRAFLARLAAKQEGKR